MCLWTRLAHSGTFRTSFFSLLARQLSKPPCQHFRQVLQDDCTSPSATLVTCAVQSALGVLCCSMRTACLKAVRFIVYCFIKGAAHLVYPYCSGQKVDSGLQNAEGVHQFFGPRLRQMGNRRSIQRGEKEMGSCSAV